MIGKNLRKVIEQVFLLFRMLERKKYILLMFQNITQIVLNKLHFQPFQTENDGIILH